MSNRIKQIAADSKVAKLPKPKERCLIEIPSPEVVAADTADQKRGG